MWRYLLKSACVLLLLLLVGWLLFSLALPRYVEHRLGKALEGAGVSGFRGKVARLGPTAAELRGLSLGSREKPTIAVGRLRLEYSPFGLLHQQLKRLTVSGLTIRAELTAEGLRLPGLDASRLLSRGQGEEGSFRLSVEEIRLEHGLLLLTGEEREAAVPFRLQASAQPGRKTQLSLTARPAGQRLLLAGHLDPEVNELTCTFATDGDLSAAVGLLPAAPGLLLGGVLHLDGQARLGADPWSLKALQAEGRIEQGSFAWQRWRGRSGLAGENAALGFRAHYGEEGWHVMADGLSLQSPLEIQISALKAALQSAPRGVTGTLQGRLTATPGGEGLAGLRLSGPFALEARLTGRRTVDGRWQVEGRAEPVEKATLSLETPVGPVTLRRPALTLAGRDMTGSGLVRYALEAESAVQQTSGRRVRLAGPRLAGEAALRAAAPGTGRAAWPFSLRAGTLAWSDAAATLEISDPELAGRLQTGPGPLLSGTLSWPEGTLRLADQPFSLCGLTAEVPLVWPFPAQSAHSQTDSGHIGATQLQWRELALGPVSVTLRPQDREVAFSLRQQNTLIPGLVLQAEGEAALQERGMSLTADFRVPPFPAAPIQLGKLVPAAAGYELAGRLQADGRLRWGGGQAGGELAVSLENGRLTNPELGLEVEGLQLAWSFPQLFPLQSRAGETIRFDRARAGSIEVRDGRLRAQSEPAGGVLLEQAGVGWAGGRLLLYGLRLAPGLKTHRAMLFCDRLRIADLLESLGIARAEGEATLSGMIPILLEGEELRFGNGFLYSSPGKGGRVRFRAGPELTEMVSGASGAPVAFVMEALQNFEYTWARVFLETEQEQLLLRLELEGRPVEPLPFAFDEKLGSMVRLKGEAKAGITRPVRLDVNFRVDLERLLHYGLGIRQLLRMTE